MATGICQCSTKHIIHIYHIYLNLSHETITYTQSTSKCRIQLECETPLGEASVEDNSYSIVKTNNDG